MRAVCVRCGVERSTTYLERLHEVVGQDHRLELLYEPAVWPGAPWVCTARTSCKVRAKRLRRSVTAAEVVAGLKDLEGCEHCGRRGPLDDESLCQEGCVR